MSVVRLPSQLSLHSRKRPKVYFATSGTQTLRIQTREDDLAVDQIVLSPFDYLSVAPGSLLTVATSPPPPPRPFLSAFASVRSSRTLPFPSQPIVVISIVLSSLRLHVRLAWGLARPV